MPSPSTAPEQPAPPRELSATLGLVPAVLRARQWGCQPFTVWITGLSGAGKSTLAHALEKALFERAVPSLVLDGDGLRLGLNQDLGFDAAARRENIRRVAELARLINVAGLPAIVALISPLEADREAARAIVGADRFIEVHLSTTLAVCERRDPKGLYRKARARLIPEFTGISAPYEPPRDPALRLDTGQEGVTACMQRLLRELETSQGLQPASSACRDAA